MDQDGYRGETAVKFLERWRIEYTHRVHSTRVHVWEKSWRAFRVINGTVRNNYIPELKHL